MARQDKVAAVAEVRERLGGATAAVLTEYRGLTVAELAELRGELRGAAAQYKVVKNTLTRLATRDAGYDVPDEVLTGPTAVAFCDDDPVAVAKILRAFSRTHPALVVKGGILEGRVIDAAETMQLADLLSREELLARLAGLMQAVVAQPARLAQASLARMARLFAALQQKQAAADDAPQDEASPDDEPAEAPADA